MIVHENCCNAEILCVIPAWSLVSSHCCPHVELGCLKLSRSLEALHADWVGGWCPHQKNPCQLQPWLCWHIPVIPALKKLRQENEEFKVILSHTAGFEVSLSFLRACHLPGCQSWFGWSSWLGRCPPPYHTTYLSSHRFSVEENRLWSKVELLLPCSPDRTSSQVLLGLSYPDTSWSTTA